MATSSPTKVQPGDVLKGGKIIRGGKTLDPSTGKAIADSGPSGSGTQPTPSAQPTSSSPAIERVSGTQNPRAISQAERGVKLYGEELERINQELESLTKGKGPGLSGDPLTQIIGDSPELRDARARRDELLKRKQEFESKLSNVQSTLEGADPTDTSVSDIVGEAGPGAVESLREGAQEQKEAVSDVQEDIRTGQEELEARADEREEGITQATEDSLDAISSQRDWVKELPGDVQDTVNQYLDRFETKANEAMDRVEGLGREAVDLADQGRISAMVAATEGMQSAVRDQVSQISSDPNIPPHLKKRMIAQVKMGGTQKMAGIVGQTSAQFAQMQSQAMTATMHSVAGLAQTTTGARANLLGTGMSTVAQAKVAAREMGNQLTQMETQARQWGETMKFQVDNYRLQAYNTGNTLMLQSLPLQQEASMMMTDSFLLDLNLATTALQLDKQEGFMTRMLELQEQAVGQADRAAQQQFWMGIGQVLPAPIDWWAEAFGLVSGGVPGLFGGGGRE